MGPSIIACTRASMGPNDDSKSGRVYPVVVNNLCNDGDFIGVCTRPEEDDFEYVNSVC